MAAADGSAATDGGPLVLDVLGPTGAYRARNRQSVPDLTGAPAVELGLAPRLFVSRAMNALRAATPLPLDGRVAAIARAGELFATAELGGLTPEAYERAVSRIAYIPLPVVRTATRTLARRTADLYRGLRHARPMRRRRRLARPAHPYRTGGVGPARRGPRRPRRLQPPRHAQHVARSAGPGLPGGGTPLPARTPHPAPARHGPARHAASPTTTWSCCPPSTRRPGPCCAPPTSRTAVTRSSGSSPTTGASCR